VGEFLPASNLILKVLGFYIDNFLLISYRLHVVSLGFGDVAISFSISPENFSKPRWVFQLKMGSYLSLLRNMNIDLPHPMRNSSA